MWQMESLRRFVSGTIAEMAPEALVADILSRTLGLYRLGVEVRTHRLHMHFNSLLFSKFFYIGCSSSK